MRKEGSRPMEEETIESTPCSSARRAGLRERYRVVVGKSRVTPRCCSLSLSLSLSLAVRSLRDVQPRDERRNPVESGHRTP